MTAEAFWSFSVALYDRPQISEACLALQDEHGVDVDLVLFALWCASRGHRLGAAELGAADAAVASWRDTVARPIRRVRRALTTDGLGVAQEAAVLALRTQVLGVELAAERLQHGMLEALAPPPGQADPSEAAGGNLARLAELAGVPADAAPFAVLARAVS